MIDTNLPHCDPTPYYRRAHAARAQAAATLVHTAVRGVRGWAAGFAAARARRRLRRETVKQLAVLSDRTLQDIGIPRSAIWSVANDLVNAAAGTTASDREPPQTASPTAAPANQNRPSRPVMVRPAIAGCG